MRATGWWVGVMVLGLALPLAAQEGTVGFMAGSLLPPGQYIANFATYHDAQDTFTIGNANGGGWVTPSFDIKERFVEFEDTVQFINVTDISVLGGNWAQRISVPYVWEEYKVAIKSTSWWGYYTQRFTDKNAGVGNIMVDPFVVGWHKPPFHWSVGMDAYIPESWSTVGGNNWSFEPLAAVTYLNDGRQELSATTRYVIPTEDEDQLSSRTGGHR